jgi:hypothetical protein
MTDEEKRDANRVAYERGQKKFLNGRWVFAQYTCPKCKAPKAFHQIENSGDCRCICQSCGYDSNAYMADWNEWPTISFGRK